MPERIRRGQRAALYALLAASWLLTASVGPARADPERTAVAQLTPSLLSDEAYTEGWDYYFYFPDGAWITVQLFVSNFGPGDHRALLFPTRE